MGQNEIDEIQKEYSDAMDGIDKPDYAIADVPGVGFVEISKSLVMVNGEEATETQRDMINKHLGFVRHQP